MSRVVNRIEDINQRVFELYDDGDCVLTIPSFGHVQITADILQKLSLNKSSKSSSTELPAFGRTPAAVKSPQIVVSSQNKTADDVHLQNFTRKYSPLDDKSGWLCIFKIPGSPDISHVYVSRSFARQSTPSTPIGTAGRIS